MDAFEKLEVWKRSSRLCVSVYALLRESRDWAFRDQMVRSALSIPSNIAEGYERNSRKEYVQFLRIAKGSCGELRSQLYVADECGIIESVAAKNLVRETGEISRMLGGLISRLQRTE